MLAMDLRARGKVVSSALGLGSGAEGRCARVEVLRREDGLQAAHKHTEGEERRSQGDDEARWGEGGGGEGAHRVLGVLEASEDERESSSDECRGRELHLGGRTKRWSERRGGEREARGKGPRAEYKCSISSLL